MFAYPFCMLCTHLRTIVVLEASQVDICAPRGVFTLMAANWPLMSVNVFWAMGAMSVNGLATAQLWKNILCVVINVLTYVNQNRNHLAVLDFST